MSENGNNGKTAVLPRPAPPASKDELIPEASSQFICTAYVEQLSRRALAYVQAGLPVHFAGPAGTGKTTLAFHIAASRGRPVILIHGDDEFGSSDLIGKDSGYRKSLVVDNFIHSVVRTEEELKTMWMDNRLTTACERGYTLIYDEFNRSRPEANNALLSILSENLLSFARGGNSGKESYVAVHPEFRCLFTSNPEEYAGTHRAQDALMDRMVTLQLGHYDRDTEIEITIAKSGIDRDSAVVIVDTVRQLRELGANHHRPTIRACIAMARVLVQQGAQASWNDPVYRWVAQDVLRLDGAHVTRQGEPLGGEEADDVLRRLSTGHGATL